MRFTDLVPARVFHINIGPSTGDKCALDLRNRNPHLDEDNNLWYVGSYLQKDEHGNTETVPKEVYDTLPTEERGLIMECIPFHAIIQIQFQ